MKQNKKAICILSGGMDSTLASYIAKNNSYEIITVHFNYGQKTMQKELEAFRNISNALNVPKKQQYEIDIPFFGNIGANALCDDDIEVPTGGLEEGIPVTYVPFRNGIFLSIATAIAEKEEAKALFIGVVQEDSSGYPDCTDTFISKMQSAMNQGTAPKTSLQIITPLVHLSKEQIVKKAVELNVPLELTWSCYKNSKKACGVCDSCRLRLNGFKMANIQDKIPYEEN